MLNGINITHIWVFDQDQALEFYVGKLGLEVSNDIDLGVMRWLTVRVPGQPGRDILLEKLAPPSVDPQAAEQLRELIAKGASGFAAGFTTGDCRAVFEDLKGHSRSVRQPPAGHSAAGFALIQSVCREIERAS